MQTRTSRQREKQDHKVEDPEGVLPGFLFYNYFESGVRKVKTKIMRITLAVLIGAFGVLSFPMPDASAALLGTFTTGILSGSSNNGDMDGDLFGSIKGSVIYQGTNFSSGGNINNGYVGSASFTTLWSASTATNMNVFFDFSQAQVGGGTFSANFQSLFTGPGPGGGGGSIAPGFSTGTASYSGVLEHASATPTTSSSTGLPTIASTGAESTTWKLWTLDPAPVPEIPAQATLPLLAVLGLGMFLLRKRFGTA
jgi:hypothetical protein